MLSDFKYDRDNHPQWMPPVTTVRGKPTKQEGGNRIFFCVIAGILLLFAIVISAEVGIAHYIP